jgi:hypothetical protein
LSEQKPVQLAAKRFVIPQAKTDGRGEERFSITRAERDREVFLAGKWPGETATALGNDWQPRGGHLFRRIEVYGEGEDRRSSGHKLWEALLRFPNSPLYDTHRPRALSFEFEPGRPNRWPNLHTMRVIGWGDGPKHKVRHVYLLHNGLNETNDLLFHYRLAAWMVGERPDAICILRPLPGHLTRFPFHSQYAELPLDGYLRDPADLFRQFLRYMQETQWLLSALSPRPHYAVTAGTRLLSEAVPRSGGKTPIGRAREDLLAEAVAKDWNAAFEISQKARRKTHSEEPVGLDTIQAAIVDLRKLLKWSPVISDKPPARPQNASKAKAEAPCIHVVGYSMGGFMAQAAFFAWPFAISSCTNLFAGGALRDLAPTGFAHPEEWQAVLHALRYEQDRAFREPYLRIKDDRIAGIDADDFAYFTRIFYEVYLQYYRGGYASRVSEFSRRLLFVVGGHDPIVQTKNVLDAGPPEGMTLLQIADLSHRPDGPARGTEDGGKVESEQREYWLPEVGRVIHGFSERCEKLLHRTLAECWGITADRELDELDVETTEDEAESFEPPPDRDPTILASTAFAHELRKLVGRALDTDEAEGAGKEEDKRGWLLVARNEIPPAFLGPTAFRVYGQALHHSEEQIMRYVGWIQRRALQLCKRRNRVSLLVPVKSKEWLCGREERQTFFSKSETPRAARIPSDDELADMWTKFNDEWIKTGAVRLFKGKEYDPGDLGKIGEAAAKKLGVDKLSLTILPDVWIALSAEAVHDICGEENAEREREDNERQVVDWLIKLVDPSKKDETRLKAWIDKDYIMVITVSAAELNPRFRGRRLKDVDQVRKAVLQWAVSYEASKPGTDSTPATQARAPKGTTASARRARTRKVAA